MLETGTAGRGVRTRMKRMYATAFVGDANENYSALRSCIDLTKSEPDMASASRAYMSEPSADTRSRE